MFILYALIAYVKWGFPESGWGLSCSFGKILLKWGIGTGRSERVGYWKENWVKKYICTILFQLRRCSTIQNVPLLCTQKLFFPSSRDVGLKFWSFLHHFALL